MTNSELTAFVGFDMTPVPRTNHEENMLVYLRIRVNENASKY